MSKMARPNSGQSLTPRLCWRNWSRWSQQAETQDASRSCSCNAWCSPISSCDCALTSHGSECVSESLLAFLLRLTAGRYGPRTALTGHWTHWWFCESCEALMGRSCLHLDDGLNPRGRYAMLQLHIRRGCVIRRMTRER
jgi:hypothetical protein